MINVQSILLRSCLCVCCLLVSNGCGIFPSTSSCYNPTHCAELKNGIWGDWHDLNFTRPRVYVSYNSYSYDIYIYTGSHPAEYDLKVSINKSSAVQKENGTLYNAKIYVKEDLRLAQYGCFSPKMKSFFLGDYKIELPPSYGPQDGIDVKIKGDIKFSKSIEKGGLYGVVMIYYGDEEGFAFYFGPR